MAKIKNQKIEFFALFMMPTFILIGFGGLILQVAGGNIVMPLVVISGIISIVIVQLAYENYLKTEIAWFFGIGIAFIYVLFTFSLFKDGFAATYNSLIDSIKEIRPYSYTVLAVSTDDITIAKTVFWVWLAAVSGGLLSIDLRKHNNLLLIICIMIWCCMTVIFNSVIAPFWILVASFSLMIWFFHSIAYNGMISFDAALAGHIAILIRSLAVTVVIVLIFNILIPQDTYSKPELFERIQLAISDSTETLRYGKETNGLTGGKVDEAGNLERSKDPALEVCMSEANSYYLRGFVGENYENSRWSELKNENLYNDIDLFYWLHQDGFYGLSQLHNAAMLSNKDLKENSLSIRNVGASSKYIYAPYELTGENLLLFEKVPGDTRLVSKGLKGNREYVLSVNENLVKQYQNVSKGLIEAEASGKANDYKKYESYYNQFVYNNYISVPVEISSLLSEYLGDYIVLNGESHFDYQSAKQNITFFMTNKMKYSENVSPTGRDVDFILNFLEGTKEGYDIHFASAATMMFRYYGIPARYVEGYLITKEDVSDFDAAKSLTIDGTHAHAWVEYYHDGIGWLPFEVTPTYLNVMETSDVMKDISSLIGQYEGEDKTIQDESTQEPQTEEGIQSFLVKHKMLILLCALAVLVLILIVLFIMWIIRERRKVNVRIASFDDDDINTAICNIFEYMMDLLLAWGLEPKGVMLEDYTPEISRLMKVDIREEYLKAVDIRQEAKYSTHIMTENDRNTIKDLETNIKEKMWKDSNFLQRLKYKYMYFL